MSAAVFTITKLKKSTKSYFLWTWNVQPSCFSFVYDTLVRIEKVVEIEKIVEVEIERIVEVPVERIIEVERVIEVEKPRAAALWLKCWCGGMLMLL